MLLAGTGAIRSICCWSAPGTRPLRRLQLLDRASRRDRALSLMNQGKEVKFFCVGRKL